MISAASACWQVPAPSSLAVRSDLHPGRRYFLPPIIFYAGLSVKKKKFFRNFGSIATLGILGTYILFAVIAFCLYAISMLPNLLSFAVRRLDHHANLSLQIV
jgi:NhaP-type Na+/H+ or K+/H+ antiporter